jgi:rhamnose utilization protein RhaD (predicted bifunctional aldolase and dehydrogenase)
VKGSGTSLATIRPEDFVVLEREKLDQMWNANYPEEEKAREAAVLADMMAARVEGETRRPSVETVLHDLLEWQFVLHLHPASVNGITCSVSGQATIARLFPNAVWVPNSKPGYTLAMLCMKALAEGKAATGVCPQLIFLENHGVFFAADTTEEIDGIVADVMGKIRAEIKEYPDFTPVSADEAKVSAMTEQLLNLCGGAVAFAASKAVAEYDPTVGCFTPDHIVYCKANPMVISEGDDVAEKLAAYRAANGHDPRIVYCNGLGVFSVNTNQKNADTALTVFHDGVKISVFAKSFGGLSVMPQWLVHFIVNWEVESYRAKVSAGN